MAELYYPTLLADTEAYPANIMFTFYERKDTSSSSIKDIVHLYMPENFGQPSTVSWDQFSKLESTGNLVTNIGKVIPGGDSAMVRKFQSFLNKYGNVASDIIGRVKKGSGTMFNPYIAQDFKGVDFRKFQFSFTFVPFSMNDCERIKEILNIFRKWSLPSGPFGGANSAFLNYPGEVEIQYQFGDGENPWIHRFKRSVITTLDINYTGAGQWTMMRNGFPTETTMTIALGEIQIVVREDIEEGY